MRIFDIEANGLLDTVSKIHMLSVTDLESGEKLIFRGHADIESYITNTMSTPKDDPVCGHGVISYDIPALQKVFPGFICKVPVVDTLVLSRLIFSELIESDQKLSASGKLPKALTGSHSLKAWGYRLGEHKGDFDGPWDVQDMLKAARMDPANDSLTDEKLVSRWLKNMETYCDQDVAVTAKLYLMLKARNYSPEAIELEHAVQWIIQRQIRHGVVFNVNAAQNLYADLLIRKDQLTRELEDAFGSWYGADGKTFSPARDNERMGYTQGAPITKLKVIKFNPGSRQHIAKVLMNLGWKPAAHTESGLVEINEKILTALIKYPHVDKLLDYFIVAKRMSQILDGEAGWLKKVTPEGRIHGNVNSNGTVTGRMTHSGPNLAQVPKVGKPYGTECRGLFGVPKGKVMVGCDASGLEGRTLGHYTARYDEGVYARILIEGDVHWENCMALGLIPLGTARQKDETHADYAAHRKARDIAKTWFYAWMYGAGDKKLAVTLNVSVAKAKQLRASFLKNAGSLGALQADIIKAVTTKGTLTGIDGRILEIRSEHSALNTLLQSCGAIVMKKALVILDEDLQRKGWTPGVDYEFLLNVHDEWQMETLPERADFLAETAIGAIRKAGLHFKLRVPMDGDAVTGKNWAETH